MTTVLFYFDHQIKPGNGGTERVSDILAHAFQRHGMTIYYCARYNDGFSSDIETLFLPNPDFLLSGENIDFLETEIEKKQVDYIINQASNGDDVYLFNHQSLNIAAKIISVLHFSVYEGINYFKELQLINFGWDKPMLWLPNLIRVCKRPYNKYKAFKGKSARFSFLYNYSDAVVVLSHSYVDDFRSVAKLSETSKLHVVHNPLTYLKTESCPKENMLLFVGRLSFQEKRLDRLIYIWNSLYRKYPEWTLNIIGDGHDRLRLEALVNRLGMERVFFLGAQNPQKYYEKAKLFCMTSTHEGLPMVLLEAMQNQVVPLAFSSFGAALEIISDGVNGYLIEPFSLDNYCMRLEQLMDNSILLNQMANRTVDNLEKFNIENICDCWLRLLERIK